MKRETVTVVECPVCAGLGAVPAKGMARFARLIPWRAPEVPCKTCGGTGEVPREVYVEYERALESGEIN